MTTIWNNGGPHRYRCAVAWALCLNPSALLRDPSVCCGSLVPREQVRAWLQDAIDARITHIAVPQEQRKRTDAYAYYMRRARKLGLPADALRRLCRAFRDRGVTAQGLRGL